VIFDIDDVFNGIKNDHVVKRAIANRPYMRFYIGVKLDTRSGEDLVAVREMIFGRKN